MPAVVAVEAEEAMGQDAAAKEGSELLLYEARSGLVSASRAGEEGLELLTNDPMEERLLRRPRVVGALCCAFPDDSMGAV